MKKITLFIFSVLASAGTLKAQTESPDTTARYFLIQASISNLQEIASGKLAETKGTRADVKSFGKMMVADHGQSQMKLIQLAKAQQIVLPVAATDTPVPDMILTKASGIDFDKLYVHAMEPAHREALMLFQKYAIAGKNPAVKAFAQQMLPVLKQHLAEVSAIDNQLKTTAGK